MRNEQRAVKYVIVGAGRVAATYAEAFKRCPEAELVAVVDINLQAAKALSKDQDCRSFRSIDSMLRETEVLAGIVCTPPATHPEISIALMKAGIHVLCEKPFSINSDEACQMVRVAAKCAVKLTMASKFRFVHDILAAKKMVSSGVLGDLILFENVFASRVSMANRWNAIPEISGGGVLIDNGTHSVDLMRYFLGPLSQVNVLEGKRIQGLAVEDTVSMFVRSANGTLGSINLSWSVDKQTPSFLDVYGSEGAISIGWKESKYLDYSKREWVGLGVGYDKVEAFRSQITNFSRAICGQEPLMLTPEEAIASVTIMEAAYRALRQNQWVEIPLDPWVREPHPVGHYSLP